MGCPNCFSTFIITDGSRCSCGCCGYLIEDSPLCESPELSYFKDSCYLPEISEYTKTATPGDTTIRYRFAPHSHKMQNHGRIQRCLQATRSLCIQLKLFGDVEDKAAHIIRELLAKESNDVKPPLSSSKVDIVAILFIVLRRSKSCKMTLRELTVCS